MSAFSLRRAVMLTLVVGGATAAIVVPAFARGGGGSQSSSCMGTTDPFDAGTITWSPAVVWPPNHKLVPITISWTENSSSAADNDMNTLKVTDISSVGADGQGTGSGKPTAKQGPDYTGVGNSASAADGSPATLTVYVRAERAGTDKAGRTYTISLSCQSGMEGSGTSMAVVTVPHDMGNNTSTTTTSSSKSSTTSSTAATSLLGRLP
jgi:hypothetical protein